MNVVCSPTIRGIVAQGDIWGEKPVVERSEKDAVTVAIRRLYTAEQFDSATGKARPEDDIFPTVALVTKEGYRFLSDQELTGLCQTSLKRP